MKISVFKSGKWVNQYQYKSFLPETINHAWTIDDDRMNLLLSQAALHLGELNAFSSLIPDVDIFIKMHVQKEAMNSSRIEGTRTSMEESLNKEENIDPEKRNDWQEVGAAMRTRDGRIITGVNIDAYLGRMAVCAEARALVAKPSTSTAAAANPSPASRARRPACTIRKSKMRPPMRLCQPALGISADLRAPVPLVLLAVIVSSPS